MSPRLPAADIAADDEYTLDIFNKLAHRIGLTAQSLGNYV
jgi:hypothetical protein